MSKRDSDRIEIDLSWTVLANNPIADWAIKYLTGQIKEEFPPNYGLKVVKTEHKPIYQAVTGNKREGVKYRLHYKSSGPGRRMIPWPDVLRFVQHLRELEKTSPIEINFVAKIDLQKCRLPWAFTEVGNDMTVPSLSLRPGARKYSIKLPAPIQTPKGVPRMTKLFGGESTWVSPTADEIMIVGEPRQAYKAWRYFQQLERGGTLQSKDQRDQRMRYALGDLVTILTRDTTKSDEWYIYSEDNNECPRMLQRFILAGNAEDTPMTYLGLDYEFVDLKPYLNNHDPKI